MSRILADQPHADLLRRPLGFETTLNRPAQWRSAQPWRPVRPDSLEIVEARLPSRVASVRSESPATRLRDSSSRSASDGLSGERSLTRRFYPPVRAMKRWIDLVEQPTAAAAASNVDPPQIRRSISARSAWLGCLALPGLVARS